MFMPKGKILDTLCPICGAENGIRCRDEKGKPRKMHAERIDFHAMYTCQGPYKNERIS